MKASHGRHLSADDVGNERLFILGHSVLIFAAELMLYGGIADKIVAFAKAGWAHPRRPRHEQRGRLHAVRWRVGLAVADVSAMGA